MHLSDTFGIVSGAGGSLLCMVSLGYNDETVCMIKENVRIF